MGHLLEIARKVQMPQGGLHSSYDEINELNELASSTVVDYSPATESPTYPSSLWKRPFPKRSPETSEELQPSVQVEAIWPPEVQSLVNWFMILTPPTEPFYLESHLRIDNPIKFFQSLRLGIETSPRGPRGRHGALQWDLLKLKAYFDERRV
jgi:hypothetical protein